MKILILSPYPEGIINTLKKYKDDFEVYTDILKLDFLEKRSFDFIVSFGYRRIISSEIINKYRKSIINLHLSFLPFNRGSHPNLWSHIENTPSGISIHFIDEGIDTGDLIFRKEVFIDRDKNTFKSSYELLVSEIEELFDSKWPDLKKNKVKLIKDNNKGTFHFYKDGLLLINKLNLGWDTNINEGINELRKLKLI